MGITSLSRIIAEAEGEEKIPVVYIRRIGEKTAG